MYIDTQDEWGAGDPRTERRKYKTARDYRCRGLRDSDFKDESKLTRKERRMKKWERNTASGIER
jgi:hypothetical protein